MPLFPGDYTGLFESLFRGSALALSLFEGAEETGRRQFRLFSSYKYIKNARTGCPKALNEK